MRRTLLTAAISLTLLVPGTLLVPAAAQAHSASASEGGVKATLSYTGGPGITTRNERLTITRGGKRVYDQLVPSKGCTKVCGPAVKQPVTVANLYGNGGEDVVLTLWNGGADCCTLADVYVPSASTGSYVLDQYNFGEAGFKLESIGPKGRPEFVSADQHFYCVVSVCAASALPLQIFQFNAESFVNVTKSYPKLISADAAHWYTLYFKNPKHNVAAIVAWAADEYNLGSQASAIKVLKRQVTRGFMKANFEAGVQRFLGDNHY